MSDTRFTGMLEIYHGVNIVKRYKNVSSVQLDEDLYKDIITLMNNQRYVMFEDEDGHVVTIIPGIEDTVILTSNQTTYEQ